jgi:imidazole glycerol-phosphate synthase subunit HisH
VSSEPPAPRIAIVDYGMGNLRSVEKALERTGAEPFVTSDHDLIRAADGVVLPGVGAFPKAMQNLRRLGLVDVLRQGASDGRPLLGICLGLQLLFRSSSENEGDEGLGLLDGRVERLPAPDRKVPLIGWSPVHWEKQSRLNEELPDHCPFYFVHSYAPVGVRQEDRLGSTEYGEQFVCAVEHGSIYGAQFHPEKSSSAGLRLLENFNAICSPVPAHP